MKLIYAAILLSAVAASCVLWLGAVLWLAAVLG